MSSRVHAHLMALLPKVRMLFIEPFNRLLAAFFAQRKLPEGFFVFGCFDKAERLRPDGCIDAVAVVIFSFGKTVAHTGVTAGLGFFFDIV